MLKRTKILAGVGAAVVVLGGAGGGIALADSSTPAPPSSPAPAAASAAKHGKALLGRVGHGEVTLNGKKHQVVDLQRGQVQSVSPTAVTVRSNDGFTATYTVGGTTKVRKAKQASAIGQVAVNDRVFVVATKAGATATATRITDAGAPK
ncbi:hypothetical protein LWP59_36715 [Amycolatopsis acidiphila]|uniref:DUF5666 domain-containing protein n=1 Tax=Amycolatopsis acidiphila TaxID=715473 RepID=A0A557ZTS5_9PSEU|nr:hypothetical protein [Amycolatopsis acidiphila]TVT15419.1 hypothetical protein FNH06_36285 [Amycolatopsis acidiphila]UIJ59511.1 hypothetical protein LWP59_36715 [Amycolatopsis acidiphila]GHG80336.1 hypothetical protein GCM10017788_49240 [Amycolatopsis acidiphila]